MESPQAQPDQAKPKTKKVRMPDGEIRVKVQQPDGSWKWQKSDTTKKPAPPTSASPSSTSDQQPALATADTPNKKSAVTKPTKAATFPVDKAATKKAPTKKKPANTAATVGKLFRAAKILDAVLPEHLKVVDDLAEDLGFDPDDNNNSKGGHPTSASSKQLAKLAAGGMKTKAKRVKRSVYRPGDTGSSDESDLDEKSPSSSADNIGTVKEKMTTEDNKAFDEKSGLEITEKEIKPVKKRPTKGRKLQRRSSRLAQGISWGIALFFPLLFLVLAMINASLAGKSAVNEKVYGYTTLGTRLKQVNKICVSMWPILFGAIVAQAFKMYAAWKVERGIKLITLEQLIGSHSLATAIKQPFFLQTINWTAIGMICLWALSPLAGQSFLRMLYIGDHQTNYTLTNITYPDFSQPLTYAFSDSYMAANVTAVDAFFGTAMLSINNANAAGGSHTIGNDPWTNPNFELMTNNRPHWAGSDTAYTHVGLPLVNIPYMTGFQSYINMSITQNYSFFTIYCMEAINTTAEEFSSKLAAPLYSNTVQNTWMASVPPAANDSTAIPTLYYGLNTTDDTTGNVTNELAMLTCPYFTQYVTVNITCWNAGSNCIADPYSMVLLPNSTNIVIPDAFVKAFLNTPVLQFEDQQAVWNWTLANQDEHSQTLFGFSDRLMGLVNAYWEIAFLFPILPLTLRTDNAQYVRNMVNATAYVWQGTPAYEVGWLYFSIVLISCVMLIVFGVTGIILDSRTVGPDIIGFASSLTRDNRYIKMAEEDVENFGDLEAEGASSKNAYERIRDMKHHKVMLQDVRGHEEVGKVALGSYGVKNGKPLQRDRLYR